MFVLLDPYADWEAAHIAAALNHIHVGEPKFCVKTVALEKKPMRPIGGFTVLPDYDLASVPEDFAAVLLIGGYAWRKPEAAPVADIVRRARERGALIGAILRRNGIPWYAWLFEQCQSYRQYAGVSKSNCGR